MPQSCPSPWPSPQPVPSLPGRCQENLCPGRVGWHLKACLTGPSQQQELGREVTLCQRRRLQQYHPPPGPRGPQDRCSAPQVSAPPAPKQAVREWEAVLVGAPRSPTHPQKSAPVSVGLSRPLSAVRVSMDAPFHIQSLFRAPTGHKAGLPGVRGPGAPLPSELQAWGREDMTTKNLSEGVLQFMGSQRVGHN